MAYHSNSFVTVDHPMSSKLYLIFNRDGYTLLFSRVWLIIACVAIEVAALINSLQTAAS